ncbi:MAG: molybdenum cofactor guanylyltransferase [Rhizobiaceae bacterium]|nr:molybdenum cofactor guanylyltransferase [Rhizobiaceae bacterium]
MRVAGLVLAGGGSRRMGGGDKFLLELAGKPLIEHVVERLAPQVDGIAISANCEPALLPPGLAVLPDRAPSRGPLSGLLSGLRWAAEVGASHVATAAADTPFLPRDLVPRLATALGDRDVAIAASRGRFHPTFGLWSADLLPALADYLDTSPTSRVLDFANARGNAFADFPALPDDPFFNVNEPGDIDEARRRAGA